MSSNPFFLISIIISALISFATAALIVETSIAILKRSSRFHSWRVLSFLRCLPFIFLCIDLISSTFSIGYLFNPLNCTSCVQKLLLTLFFPDFKTYLYTNEISLLRYLGESTSHKAFEGIGIILVGITLFLFLKKLLESFSIIRFLGNIAFKSKLCSRSIENPLLRYALLKNGVALYVSEKITIPMATYSKHIFIPEGIENTLSQAEFEAVVAHELEHIIWKDPLVRLFSQLISSIFWWVPSYEWRKKLEFDQEIACDHSISHYGIKKASLASALLQVTQQATEKTEGIVCYLTNKKHPSIRRLETMLGKQSKSSKWSEWASFVILMSISTVIFICAMLTKN